MSAGAGSWLYFPGGDVPFYCVTNFAKYSPANVPGGDTARFCAYLTESAYAPGRRPDLGALEERVVEGLVTAGVVEELVSIASVHTVDAPYAYPLPTLDRDAALDVVQPWLLAHAIASRGRFGLLRYEVGNMDHAVKMGIDVARLLVEGRPEEIWS
jgi:hypothetical protein